ncbi:MAG: hypothetical protein FE78DRAFT_442182 [Acidomyces sp. 'richmondensis']|nr:MAG: hypothetical protein FE78DRAFT_442182 [Acidomyces sp. 'richmondensis']
MWLCVLPRSAIGLLLLLLLLAPALTTAGVPLNPYNPLAKKAFFSYNSSSSTLETTLPLSDDADAGSIFVFALNAVPATGDLYFHMHTNVAHSWFGVGIGTDMPGAFMLVAYPSANSTGVTTSARIAEHGYSEPTFIGGAEIDGGLTLGPVEKIFNDEYAPAANTVGPQITISHCVCRGCARYAGDRLSFNNTAQPFFFALGPKNRKMADDSPYAGLRRHSFTGHFTMDMIAASTPSDFVDGATYGRVPAPDVDEQLSSAGHGVFATANASRIFDGQVDHDWRTSVHGITMGVGFLFVLPAGALLLKVVKSVLWHGIAQTVGVILVAVGFGAAVGLSKEFNRVSEFPVHLLLRSLLCGVCCVECALVLRAGWVRVPAADSLSIYHLTTSPSWP